MACFINLQCVLLLRFQLLAPLHWKECRPHWVAVPGMDPTREENWGKGMGEGEGDMADAMRREGDQQHVYLFGCWVLNFLPVRSQVKLQFLPPSQHMRR